MVPTNEAPPIPSDGAETPPEVGGIDLHAGEKGEDDGGEGGDEVEPRLRVHVEGIPREHAESELDERDRHAQLDGDDACSEDDSCENCCGLTGAHRDLHF